MKSPRPFKLGKRNTFGFCLACRQWTQTDAFKHEGIWWSLCYVDWLDYWDNTEKLQEDYIG